MSDFAVIVLAAGQGTRMKSRRAKVLHELCGQPMLAHVLRAARRLDPARLLVVVGRDADAVRTRFAGEAEFVLQAEQRGTSHAVQVAEPSLGDGFSGDVLVLYGDTPLLRPETLEHMRAVKRERRADLVVLTAETRNIPGIIVRDAEGRVARIVESQDATPEELAIEERNTGVYLFDAGLLRDGLAALRPNNAQGELYLTDVIGWAVAKGLRVEGTSIEDVDECMGINTRAQLADAAACLRRRIARGLMDEGVSFVDPDSVYIDVDVRIGRDSLIEPGVVITGDSVLGENVHVKAGCVIEESRLDDDVTIGPSAHLRPHSHLMRGVKVGNYVEVKNSTLGPGSKAAHLGYIGDADVGADVNFSCGAIVVNYDGYEKHRSTIGDHAFIGCNANLVSPVRVADHGFVAAGSTITKDVPEDALAVARDRQRNIEGWVARREGRAPARTSAEAAGSVAERPTKNKAKATKSSSRKTKSPARAKKKAATSRKQSPAPAKKSGAKKKSAAKKRATGRKAVAKKSKKKSSARR